MQLAASHLQVCQPDIHAAYGPVDLANVVSILLSPPPPPPHLHFMSY